MSTVREANASKDSGALLVGTIVTFVVAAFVAGVLTSGMFLAPPAVELPDLKAEYCRGIGDGEARMYNSMRDFVLEFEARAASAGYVGVSAVIDPMTGEIVEQVLISDRVFSELPVDQNLKTEAACYEFTVEQMIDFGVRGPSDYVPTTTAVAP